MLLKLFKYDRAKQRSDIILLCDASSWLKSF